MFSCLDDVFFSRIFSKCCVGEAVEEVERVFFCCKHAEGLLVGFKQADEFVVGCLVVVFILLQFFAVENLYPCIEHIVSKEVDCFLIVCPFFR